MSLRNDCHRILEYLKDKNPYKQLTYHSQVRDALSLEKNYYEDCVSFLRKRDLVRTSKDDISITPDGRDCLDQNSLLEKPLTAHQPSIRIENNFGSVAQGHSLDNARINTTIKKAIHKPQATPHKNWFERIDVVLAIVASIITIVVGIKSC